MRPALLLALAGLILAVAACPPPGNHDGDGGAALATEADVTPCGRTDTIYVNHSEVSKELFIKAKNRCGQGEPTLLPGKLWVADRHGTVDANQAVDLRFNRTHRGSFMVSGKGMVVLQCPEHLTVTTGCEWEYTVSVRF
jgi:hypothetical protein